MLAYQYEASQLCLNSVNFILLIGQIELFTHVPVLKNFVEHLKQKNFNVCVVYLLDSQVLYKFYLPSTTYSLL